MRLSISEIVNKAIACKKNEEKIKVLHDHDSPALRTVLKIMYDKRIEVLLPDTPPPWKKNDYIGIEGKLYVEARRLRIFIRGGGYDNLVQTQREKVFIQLLEDIDNNDAELLVKMIAQKPLKGLPESVVKAAFPVEFQ